MNSEIKRIPVALTVAGSDSGGGAGIQADLRTFSAHGVFGTSVITAVTSQNPLGVSRVDPISPDGVKAQLKAVFDAFSVSAMKTGMMFSCDIITAVADFLESVKIPIIVDPVMVATSGAKLLCDDALVMLQKRILPLAAWITPNLPEAEFLTGCKICSECECWEAAKKISEKWNTSVIVKGGHLEHSDKANDFVYTRSGERYLLSSERISILPYSSHGTGCTLSSALVSQIALKKNTEEMLVNAKSFVLNSLEQSFLAGTDKNQIHVMFPPQYSRAAVEIKKL